MLGAADRQAVAIVALLVSGSALSALAYASWVPAVAVVPFLCVGLTPLVAEPIGGQAERRAYGQVFAVCWFMAGIAAIYAQILGDPVQTTSDPSTLYRLATGRAGNLDVEAISTLAEGAGAIAVWRSVYRAAAGLGLEPAPYWGILVNTLLVAWSGVVVVKAVRAAFADAEVRLRHAAHLVSACGLAWMFAAIHLRDAFVLLAVSLLTLLWIRYLARPISGRLVEIVVGTVVGIAMLGFLRTEFAFLPLAMLAAGVVALTVAPAAEGGNRGLAWFAGGLGAAAVVFMYMETGGRLLQLLSVAAADYSQMSEQGASEGSLGVALVTSQPLPIKVVAGSLYLLVFPIPFWSGLAGDSVYHVFKSANVLYFYILVPMAFLGVLRLARPEGRSAPLVFALLVTVGFLMGVAGTSLENRHLGAFLLPLVLLALVPDLRDPSERRTLGRFWALWGMAVGSVHLAWVAVRML